MDIKKFEVTVDNGVVKSLSMRLDDGPMGMAHGINFQEPPTSEELGKEILKMAKGE